MRVDERRQKLGNVSLNTSIVKPPTPEDRNHGRVDRMVWRFQEIVESVSHSGTATGTCGPEKAPGTDPTARSGPDSALNRATQGGRRRAIPVRTKEPSSGASCATYTRASSSA